MGIPMRADVSDFPIAGKCALRGLQVKGPSRSYGWEKARRERKGGAWLGRGADDVDPV